MDTMENGHTILVAEDNEIDRIMAKEAMEQIEYRFDLRFVEDGQELMDYLCHLGKYSDLNNSPRPCLILLDLKMPIKDGHEALLQIKADPDLRHIPVMAMTASKAEGDISRAYDHGINSYINKPTSFPEMVELMKTLGKYWLDTVELPAASKLYSEN